MTAVAVKTAEASRNSFNAMRDAMKRLRRWRSRDRADRGARPSADAFYASP
jgi:hypothetical protein